MFFKRREKDYQKVFVEVCRRVIGSFFISYEFREVKVEVGKKSSILVYQKNKKYIRVFAEDDYWGEGSFFEVSIGEKFDFAVNDFEEYYISLTRLTKIIEDNKKETYRRFPYGNRASKKALLRAKKDFLKYASFYLNEDVDLFNRVLKLKGIKR